MLEIFTAMGMPAGTISTADTARRFLRAVFDATSGYEGDEKLVTAFPTECRGGADCRISQVVEGPIPFFSLCEHHSLPFFGKAYVGYIAHEHILGLSKLTRLLRLFARRFTGAFRDEAAGDRYRGILGVADDPVVSADIVGDPRASVVDAAMTRVVDGTLVKVMSWYDNEWGFTCQMVRESFAALGLPAPDLSQARP